MPIREYAAVDLKSCCDHCREGFEIVESMDASPAETCPRCGGRIERKLSASNVGSSKSGLDQRAKNAGFTKFSKLGKGEYEKNY